MTEKKFTCPCCGEVFSKEEASWTVCLDCGEIFPPGEDWSDHGPGPVHYEEDEWGGYGDRLPIKEWPCNSAVNTYTENAALAKQQEVRNE